MIRGADTIDELHSPNPGGPRPARVRRAELTVSSGRALWLALEPDPVLCSLHEPSPDREPSTAVVIVPPFGWDEMCSYRARRSWANALAAAGHPVARIDLPGTGDSGGGPEDADRLKAWTSAVSETATWLRRRTGAPHIAAIGIGLGGMLAYRAIADGAPIDDLVLWAVPARGRDLTRMLRAQSAMITGRHSADAKAAPPLEEGAFDAAGYLVSAETRRALDGLDLTTVMVPAPVGRRVLLLGRERIAPDNRLREHLERMGVGVSVADGVGYDAMMAPPQESVIPDHAIDVTRAWLAGVADASSDIPAKTGAAGGHLALVAEGGGVEPERDAVELRFRGERVRERALALEVGGRKVAAVLTEPVDVPAGPVCAVLLNAGALRRIGPSRTWVDLARNWATRGVPSVRVDFAGIGDADGCEHDYGDNADLYRPEFVEQTSGLLDALAELGMPERFVLGGLCSGAYWSLHAALGDRRVVTVLMLNLYPMIWSDRLRDEWRTRKVLASLRGRAWRRLLRRDVSRKELDEALRSIAPHRLLAGGRASAVTAHHGSVDRILDSLRDQGTQALLLLGREQPLAAQFEREGRLERMGEWPNVTLEEIPSDDHSFRALWVQQAVKDSMGRAIDRALAKVER